ncbi:18552_t:CDS:2 [Entrophospora sp. SA101]|nr:18552_t:CDS:2 [Entrophospora sp. SA101]
MEGEEEDDEKVVEAVIMNGIVNRTMIRSELEDRVKKEKIMNQPSGELSMLEGDEKLKKGGEELVSDWFLKRSKNSSKRERLSKFNN